MVYLSPVPDLLKDTYDYIVIVVLWENMADEIRQELILWREPIYTVNLQQG